LNSFCIPVHDVNSGSLFFFVGVCRISSSTPGSTGRWKKLQSFGRTSSRQGALHCTCMEYLNRASTMSVNSVSECHIGCNALYRGSSGDAFGPDTAVFSLLLLWPLFAVGRVFFQFSFFSCEFGIGFLPLLGVFCLLTPSLVWNQSFFLFLSHVDSRCTILYYSVRPPPLHRPGNASLRRMTTSARRARLLFVLKIP
jgi:hypothetical protein